MNLFKYYSFNANNLNAILDRKFWFSHPSHFNDPFDAQVSLSSAKDEDFLQSLAECIGHVVGKEYADLDFVRLNLGELKNGVDKHYNSPEDYEAPPFTKAFYGALDYFNLDRDVLINLLISKRREPEITTFLATQAALGITCFAGKGCDPNMWAHYGGNHQGFCVRYELDTEKLPADISTYSVKYTDDPLKPEQVDGAIDKNVLCDQLSTKAKRWESEGETRLISLTGCDKLIKLPVEVVGICFGNKMPLSEKKVMGRLYAHLLAEDQFYSAKLNRQKQRMYWACRASGFVEDYSD